MLAWVSPRKAGRLEVRMPKATWTPLLAEAVGTFTLVFAGAGSIIVTEASKQGAVFSALRWCKEGPASSGLRWRTGWRSP